MDELTVVRIDSQCPTLRIRNVTKGWLRRAERFLRGSSCSRTSGLNPLISSADRSTLNLTKDVRRPSTFARCARPMLFVVATSPLWAAAAACNSENNAGSSNTPAPSSSPATSSPSGDGATDRAVYVNHEGGYTFNYPKGWVVIEGKRAAAVVYAPPGEPRRSPANLSISVTAVSQGTDLQSYYEQNVGFLGLTPGFQLDASQRTTFASSPAFSITYSMSPKGTRFRALQTTTVVGTTAYTAIYSSPPETFERYLIGADLIVRSFKLT